MRLSIALAIPLTMLFSACVSQPWHVIASKHVANCGVTMVSYAGASNDGSVLVFIDQSCDMNFWSNR